MPAIIYTSESFSLRITVSLWYFTKMRLVKDFSALIRICSSVVLYSLASYLLLFISDDDIKDEMAGTTAVVVLMKNNKLYCVRFRKFLVSNV
jgi:hypothetical protein